MIPILSTSLSIPANRMRQAFDEAALLELINSISKLGILHPPVVRETPDGYVLVAGERRFRAMQAILELGDQIRFRDELLPEGHIPVSPINTLSDLEFREAELEENIVRADLTWDERVRAEAALHALRQEQAAARGEKQSIPATAKEISPSGNVGELSNSIILSKHLNDPVIAGAKSKQEAVKLLKKKLETQHRIALAQNFDPSAHKHKLFLGDAREHLRNLPESTYSVIITDPPYGAGAHTFGPQAVAGHSYQDDIAYALELYTILATEGMRVTAPRAHLYTFLDIRHFPIITELFRDAGWHVWPRPLIWLKSLTMGMLPRPDHGPRNCYEAILFANKGNKTTNMVAPDIIDVARDFAVSHAAQKPVEIYLDLLRRSVLPGDHILDPFCGSGPVFPAAAKLSCYATGIELDEEYYALSAMRMDAL